jgi:uncharacterized protein
VSAESTTVFFTSGGENCAADLYQSDGANEPTPCLVLGHGFSGTKGLARVYAERIAAAGLAVLVFDYRHFGASGGEPRQLVDVGKQRADYHAAVHYARTLPGIDPARIALWGTSFSGGHVLAVAAADPGIAAVVAQVPLIDARRTGRTRWQRLRRAMTRSILKLSVAAIRDALNGALRRPPYLACCWPARRRGGLHRSASSRRVHRARRGSRGMAQRVRSPVLVRIATVPRRHR